MKFLQYPVQLTILVSLAANFSFGQSNFPAFPPQEVTREMDHGQMMEQLGVAYPVLPPKLQDPNAPKGAYPADSLNPEGNWRDADGHTITRSGWGLWNNYDDQSSGFFPGPDSVRLGKYEMIDLLTTNDGAPVKTPEEWWTKRRPELLKAAQEELYGLIPPDSVLPEVTFTVETSTGGYGNLAYVEKKITGKIDLSRYPKVRDIPQINAILRLPASTTASVPVLIVFAGFGNSLDRYWEICAPQGWGVCTFNPNDLQPDNGSGLTSYLIGLVNQGNWRNPSDWGTIGAWSWGVSKLMDYFERDPEVNEKAIGLTGHSRYGKATLVTIAYEPRIAIGFPSDGGSLGTAPTRRHWGQDLENSAGANEYHWMAGNFFQWVGERTPGHYLPRKIENLTTESYTLLALCAPRPMLFNGGNQSSWTDPYGQYLTPRYATPVYELLGKKGLLMNDKKPLLDKAYLDGDLAYRYHDGGHTDAPEWPSFFEFASRYIKAPILEVPVSYISLEAGKNSTATLKVTSNQDWEITGGDSWFSINKSTEGLTIIAKENKSQSARSSILTLVTPGRERKIQVIQGTASPTMEIGTKALTIAEKEGSESSMAISSNSAWTVASSESWVYPVHEAGINTGSITLKAKANPGVEQRSASITLAGPGLEPLALTITQKEGPPTLQVGTNNLNLGAGEGSSAGFWGRSNTTWKTVSSESWLTAETSFGNFHRVTVRASANPGPARRKATLSILVNGLPPHVIEVTQEGNEY